MLRRIDLRDVFDRLQGTAATTLGLVLVALAFIYLVPKRGEIAAAMDTYWERARIVAGDPATSGAPSQEPAASSAPDPAAGPDAAGIAEPEGGAAPAPNLAAAPAEPVAAAPPGTADGLKLLARPVAIDTATIMIRRSKVRLAGVQPVPMAKKCGTGADAWFCGVDARTRFRSWLLARSISCKVPDGFGERVETIEASCLLGGEDIGRWLVRNGWAEAVAGGPYAEDERRAREAKLGVWGDRRLGG